MASRSKLGAAEIRRDGPQPLEPREEGAAFLVPGGAQAQRVKEIGVPVGRADGRELVCREAEAGRAQRGDELDVPVRVVDQRQQVDDRGDLERGEKLPAPGGGHGDAAAQQRAAEDSAHVRHLAQQDRDIAVSDRPFAVGGGHAQPCADHLLDTARDGLGLALEPIGRLGVLPVLCPVEEQQLGKGPLALVVFRAEDQRGVFVIVHVAQTARHARGEHGVHRSDDLAARAEVLPQRDAPRLALGGLGPVAEGAVFFVEDLGVGQAEAVDRLLDVPDHKEVIPRARQGAEDRVLHTADVLIFVHHDLGEVRGDLPRQRGGLVVLIREQAGGEVLEVGVIHQRGAAFGAGVFRVEIQGQAQQRLHRIVGQGHALELRPGGGGEGLFHRGAGPFAGVAPRRDGVGELRLVLGAQSAEGLEGDGQTLARRVPAVRERAGEFPQRLRRALDAGTVGLSDRLRAAHIREQAFHLRGPVVRLQGELVQQLSAPGRLRDVVHRGGERGDHALGPLLGTGVALHLAVQIQHQLLQKAVVPARADRVGQHEKAGVRLRAGVALLHRALERGGFHHAGAVVVDDAEVRRETEQVAVLPQQIGAEAVDRADLRAAAQRALAAQAAAVGLGGRGGGELGHDPPLQLGRGGAREGDNKEAVDVPGVVLVGEIAHQPLGEHAGLAAARAGGDEHGAAAALDRGALRDGRCDLAHVLPASPSNSSQTSPGLSFFK